MDDKIRAIEIALEEALETLDSGDGSDTLVNSDIDNLPLSIDKDNDEIQQTEQVLWNSLEMIGTVISTLKLRTVENTTDEQYDVLTRLYRFTSGPLRELETYVDNENDTGSTIRNRVDSHRSDLQFMLHDTDLLERAYNQNTT